MEKDKYLELAKKSWNEYECTIHRVIKWQPISFMEGILLDKNKAVRLSDNRITTFEDYMRGNSGDEIIITHIAV